jgi:hypothetical protein
VNIDQPPWCVLPPRGDPVGAALRSIFAPDSSVPREFVEPFKLKHDGEENMPRETIDTGTDKRYVRRNREGQFKESDDMGRSLAQDQKRDSKTKPKRGEGDKGDR